MTMEAYVKPCIRAHPPVHLQEPEQVSGQVAAHLGRTRQHEGGAGRASAPEGATGWVEEGQEMARQGAIQALQQVTAHRAPAIGEAEALGGEAHGEDEDGRALGGVPPPHPVSAPLLPHLSVV